MTREQAAALEHGEELFDLARAGVQLRFEAAVAGVVPVMRVLEESLAGAHIERIHGIVNGTTNYVLSEMAPRSDLRGGALGGPAARALPRPIDDDVNGRDAAAKMAILARLAFGSPVRLEQVRYEGIEQLQGDDLQYARELGLGLKLIGTAERRDGGCRCACIRRFSTPGIRSPRSAGPFNAVTVESDGDHRDHDVRPRRRGAADRQCGPRRRRQRDARPGHAAASSRCASIWSRTSRAPSTCTWRWPTAPGVLASVTQALGDQGVSIKSVVQRGMQENARLVMVTHPVLESSLRAALQKIGEFDFVRSTPRTIRVIEEEFT